jgi:hypothetical protein
MLFSLNKESQYDAKCDTPCKHMGEIPVSEHTIPKENLKERDNYGDLGVDGRIILKCKLRVWTEFNWLRIGSSSGLMWAC